MGWMAWNLNFIRQRHELLAIHQSRLALLGKTGGGTSSPLPATKRNLPAAVWFFGDAAIDRVNLVIVVEHYGIKDQDTYRDVLESQRLFPEAKIDWIFIAKDELHPPIRRAASTLTPANVAQPASDPNDAEPPLQDASDEQSSRPDK